ncbi:MAG: D-alanyl-D-alanine carboxypeptidase [Hyphomonadaceae bacterium]|nr:D-alanyl-D-alanine carboxypeptidase [Hyphomonadaceae bacterium]
MVRESVQKVLKSSLLTPLVLGSLALAAPAQAERYASIVVDSTSDTVLHARNADDPRFPASLTKVMTLYMLFDELKAGRLALEDELTISRNAASQPPSNLRLSTGGTISVRDAIGALITKSANDVAVVVAEEIGGTEERFAALMTVKATTLGMTNTRFYNASGLPDARQVSTARDMARLAEAVMEDHADYYDYFATRSFAWNGRTYRNHNELLGSVDGVDGIKTGYTRASGYNLMASAQRGDARVIAIMLGGRTSRARNAHVTELIEAAYASFSAPTGNTQATQTRIAFESVPQPVDPNAAAVPTLNGQPFPVGEGDIQ